MNVDDLLYDETESTKVRFVGFLTENNRYDFGIIFTKHFFGKPLVVCIQTKRSEVLSAEDAQDLDHLTKAFNLKDVEEAEELSEFLVRNLPSSPGGDQY